MRYLLTFVFSLSSLILFAQETTQMFDWSMEWPETPYADRKVDGVDFKVRLTDMPDTNVILGYHYAGRTYVQDTVRTDEKGLAHFKSDEDMPGGIYLIAIPGYNYFEIVYSCTEKNFYLETNMKDPLADLKIKGSPENELFRSYQLERIERGKRMKDLGDRYTEHKANKDSADILGDLLDEAQKGLQEYQINLAKEHPNSMVAMIINLMREPELPEELPEFKNPEIDTNMWKFYYFKNHYWDYVDFRDDRILRTPIFKKKVFEYLGGRMTAQTPDSICPVAIDLIDRARAANKEVYKNVLTWIGGRYEKSKIMGMNAVFVCVGQKFYMNDPAVDWFTEKEMEKIKERIRKLSNITLGSKARDLIMLDFNGVPRSLHAVPADYTLVYFWSATCGHCKKTTPKIKKIYDEYKDKGLEVFAVNTDYKKIENEDGEVVDLKEAKEYREYVKENELDWINVADPRNSTNFRTYYDIYSTPVVYLLDKDKNFIGTRLDHINLRRMLMHEIDGMERKEIEDWLDEHGYLEEEKKALEKMKKEEEGEEEEG